MRYSLFVWSQKLFDRVTTRLCPKLLSIIRGSRHSLNFTTVNPANPLFSQTATCIVFRMENYDHFLRSIRKQLERKETNPSEQVWFEINECYYSPIQQSVALHGGVVLNEIIVNDEIIAIFPKSAYHGIHCAIDTLVRFDHRNVQRIHDGKPIIRPHAALSTGSIHINSVVKSHRITHATTSDSIRFARNLVNLCEKLGFSVLLDEQTGALTKSKNFDYVKLKTASSYDELKDSSDTSAIKSSILALNTEALNLRMSDKILSSPGWISASSRPRNK